jgi:hypothetical protein
MEHINIEKVANDLGTVLKALYESQQSQQKPLDIAEIIRSIPYGSLSGDQVLGGKIKNFSSLGITDSATNTVLTVSNQGIASPRATIPELAGNVTVEKTLIAQDATIIGDLTVSGTLRANVEVDYIKLIKQIPQRSFSGDLINGGVIRNFASTGIKDSATTATRLLVEDDAVTVDNLKVSKVLGSVEIENQLTAKDIRVTGVLTAETITVTELKADIRLERSTPLEFKATKESPVIGKGLIWSGLGYPKQFILKNEDTIFSTENIDLNQGRSYMLDGVPVLSLQELGPTVSKSQLKELGNLKKLTVLGNVNVDNVLFYNSDSNKVSIGIEEGHAKFSVVENNIEIQIGTDQNTAFIGTHGSQDLAVVTDNTDRLVVKGNGDLVIGNKNTLPVQVSLFGKLAIGITNPDPSVALHVNGAVRINNQLQTSSDQPPQYGSFKRGDIVWNSEPAMNSPIGWVCLAEGTPGVWAKFGLIG